MRTRVVVLVVVASSAVAYAAGAAESPTAVRSPLAKAVNPAGAKGQTLGLSRVVIPAGAQLALHVHPGTQIAFIDKGTLTYTVKTGSVPVYRGNAEDKPKLVRRVTAGHTARIGRGDWVVEKPHVQHFGANETTKPVVILAATLLENGKPSAIPVADPDPG